MKAYEITLEANSFDGSQVFACYANDEQEAMLKLKRGECDIIESNIEVLGLDKVPIDIMESDDITSRLLSDVCARQAEQIKMLKVALADAADHIHSGSNSDGKTWIKVWNNCKKALEATKA